MDNNGRSITVHISTGTIVTAILFALLVVALFFLQQLVLVLLTAVVIASAIEPATRWFMKYRIPRVFSVLLVYLLVLSFIFGLLFFFVPPVLDEAVNLLSTLPQYINAISLPQPFADSQLLQEGQNVSTLSLREVINDARSLLSAGSSGFLQTLSAIFGGLLSLVLIVVFSFYFAVLETGVDDFLRVITPVKHQKYVVGLWKRSQIKIGRWMQGQLMLGVIVGVLVFLGLSILDVRFALLLAVIAALFELIPVFGPILAAVPAVAVAFIDGGATIGLLVIGLYVIIQQFENHLIYPLVVKKVVGVPPLMVIIALIIGGQLAGFLGIILSVPVAAVIQEFVSDIQESKRAQLEAAGGGA